MAWQLRIFLAEAPAGLGSSFGLELSAFLGSGGSVSWAENAPSDSAFLGDGFGSKGGQGKHDEKHDKYRMYIKILIKIPLYISSFIKYVYSSEMKFIQCSLPLLVILYQDYMKSISEDESRMNFHCL